MRQVTQICVYETDDETFKVKIGHGEQVVDSGDCDTAVEALDAALVLLDDADEVLALLRLED